MPHSTLPSTSSTVPRFLFPLALALALLPACDSDDGPSASEVDGEYQVTEFFFDPEPSFLDTIDLTDYLAERNDRPQLTLDLLGRDRDYVLTYRLDEDDARSAITGSFDTASNNRIIVDFGENNRRATRLLLPQRLTFTVSSDRSRLLTDANHTVAFEQLAELDPDRFGGLSGGSVSGRLGMTLVRD